MKKFILVFMLGISICLSCTAQYDSHHLNKLDSANKDRAREIRKVTIYGTAVVACSFVGIPAYPVLLFAAVDLARSKRKKK